ncbi:FHA domain-containing protein [Bdellovibrio sp. HCB337]|uniref:FHA domain-containing protein n=1 Tax=Bdellovibrio sp. HCB337 TaxID=3394358 RepID=UPI0039A6A7F8
MTVRRRDQTMTKIVNEDSFTIGRSMDCTIPLTEDSISRVHLVVHRRQDQIWVEDKGSSNGTFVNNVRIAQNSLINVVASDRIRVGKSDYVVSIQLEIEEKEDTNSLMKARADQTDLLSPVAPMAQSVQQQIQPQQPQVVLNPNTKEEKPEVKAARQASPKFGAKDLFPANKDFMPKEKEPVKEENQFEAPVAQKEQEEEEASPKHFEAERALHEAHRKGAQIIYEAEIKAEKRAQSIYLGAKERQVQADQYYQKKVQDAHKEVDRVLMSFQDQGQELLAQARQYAQEIRDEVDVFAQGMREEARKVAEQIETEARDEAEHLKHEAYEKARSKAEIEAEDLVTSANAESQDILNFAKLQAEEMLTKARNEMENELKYLIDQIDDKKKHIQNLRKEQEEQNIRALGEKEEMEGKIEELTSELKTLTEDRNKANTELESARAEDDELRAKIQDQKKTSQELEHQIGQLYGDSKTLERKNKELQETLGRFALDIQSAEDKKRMMESEVVQQKQHLKDRLDREQQVLVKESEERLHESQLDMSKRLQKLEREMLEEIMGRKETLVKDIIVIIETRIAKVLEPAKWDQVSSQIFEGISETIEGKAVTFSEHTKAPKQSASLQRKKKKENYRWMGAGVAAGIIASILGVQGYNRIQNDKNPMRTIAAEETRRRQEDLEKRRFNPAQVNDVKETYVDAVIYTNGYVAAYQDADYQQKLYKAASAYLLKTWRVDEDKSIQVLSMSSALIKELSEKKASIHPDFVKDGIAKMRNLEKESTDRMKTVLGSEVRLESYRRFERKFFETEILKK